MLNHNNLNRNEFQRKQSEYRYENEETFILEKSYQTSLSKQNLNFRYRILPYLIAKYKSIPIDDLTTNYKIVIHYDKELFQKLHQNKFETTLLTDPFYTVNLDLRYSKQKFELETFFPVIILMFNSTKINYHITTSQGMQIFVIMRLSILNSEGNEIAYCQKHLFQNVFSNDFFSEFILQKNSPFLTKLSNYTSLEKENVFLSKINQCKNELF